ncbi:periplasmic heavy metal sensor [Athalassotoga saccharophila]|uniref:periplasmic heavy metal sensor n=1 Tax=Athalassotoga saccharophila TaxID=1441386 RepID=UPI00137AEC23|nr:periplasmic heavy metal sensor [Athalassotoga saccharophila]BBJ27152.1 hypothetical protein ATHSA_0019 [Athalassotoga saccharophila]
MKKFLVLLFIPVLVTGIFAASSTTTLSLGGLLSGANAFVQESQAVQLQTQIGLLEVFNAMKLTSAQASALESYLKDFKTQVNALQDQRIKALTSLRDALVANDATQVSAAKSEIAKLDSQYAKLTENLITEVKSTITLEQVTLLQQYFEKTGLEMQRKLLGPNARNEIGQALPNRNFRFNVEVNPQQMYNMMNLLQNFGRNARMQILRSPDLVYTFVNLPFYDTLIQTLQLKAQ